MSTTKTPTLPPGVTQGDVANWKKDGPVFSFVAKHEGEHYVGLFRKPTLTILHAATAANTMDGGKLDYFGMLKTQYESCKLAVDPKGEAIDEVKSGWQNKVAALFKQVEVEVGEL